MSIKTGEIWGFSVLLITHLRKHLSISLMFKKLWRKFSLHLISLPLISPFLFPPQHAMPVFFYLQVISSDVTTIRFHFKVQHCCMSTWNFPFTHLGCWSTQVYWEGDNGKIIKDFFFSVLIKIFSVCYMIIWNSNPVLFPSQIRLLGFDILKIKDGVNVKIMKVKLKCKGKGKIKIKIHFKLNKSP